VFVDADISIIPPIRLSRRQVELADLNGDSALDVVVATQTVLSGNNSIEYGINGTNFAQGVAFGNVMSTIDVPVTDTATVVDLAIGDINSDRALDLVILISDGTIQAVLGTPL